MAQGVGSDHWCRVWDPSQACLDDDACISYNFVVGSQADSCSFYSEPTSLENRAAQTCDGHCGPIVKEECDLTFAWREYSGSYTLSSKGNPSSRRFEHGRRRVDLLRVHHDNNPDQLLGVGALAHRGLRPVWGFVREVPLAFHRTAPLCP